MQKPNDLGRNRRLVSQLLVAALFAVAYSEVVGPVTESLDEVGVNLQSLAWLLIYMATVLRFFIGNILHLESPDLTGPDGAFRWFWDLFFIVAECVILIFAGAVTTITASAEAAVSFTDYLLILYGLDVCWLVSIRLLDRMGRRWPRSFGSMVRKKDMAPFEWAEVNVFLGLVIWGLDLAGSHPAIIPDWKLILLVSLNGLAFLGDVVSIAYGIREPEGANVRPLAPPIKKRRSWLRTVVEQASSFGNARKGDAGMDLAISNARRSRREGGIPVGAALLDRDGNVLGAGRNRRVQKDNQILHAEMDCLANVGRRDLSDTVLYSTLMPCSMCAGAIVLFRIPHVVVGESTNFAGAENWLRQKGVTLTILNDPSCKEMLEDFIAEKPRVWQEDIGGEDGLTQPQLG